MNKLRDSRGRIQIEIPTDGESLSKFESALSAVGLLDDYELGREDKNHHHIALRVMTWILFAGMVGAYFNLAARMLELHTQGSVQTAIYMVIIAMLLFFVFKMMSEPKLVITWWNNIRSKLKGGSNSDQHSG